MWVRVRVRRGRNMMVESGMPRVRLYSQDPPVCHGTRHAPPFSHHAGAGAVHAVRGRVRLRCLPALDRSPYVVPPPTKRCVRYRQTLVGICVPWRWCHLLHIQHGACSFGVPCAWWGVGVNLV